MERRRNVFVMGLDPFNQQQLESLRHADEFRFHPLVRRESLRTGGEISIEELLSRSEEELRAFEGSVDAIVGYWDFPVSTLLPIVRRRMDLPTPSLEAVLRCEHKYWSRLEQQRSIPDHIPDFCAVDPFAEDVRSRIELSFPFWIKPVKSVLSHLGFCVHDAQELDRAIERIREGIAHFGDPFNEILEHAELPEEIAGIDGNHCLVESLISQGRQCTLEGYVLRGEVVVYGVVESIREGEKQSCFARYQYPARLPSDVIERMTEITTRLMKSIGFDGSPFNVELYWNEQDDRIWLLEINPRISKSHCPLFKKVDGEFHHQVMIDVALGETPRMPRREGEFEIAAKFMWRRYGDAIVHHVPSKDERESLCRRIPGLELDLHVEEGMRLSDMRYQDSYSYEVAALFLGGQSEQELERHYEECRAALDLDFEEISGSDGS